MTDLPQLFAGELDTTIGVEDHPVGYFATQDLSHAQCTFNQVRILHSTHGPA
ncbi:hypothetical protein [Corynebacterium sp. MNWGS58]|uniref:hypothetical protein n=1 Tax=Corynebacterium sp. 102791.4 TaxID=3104612 RepID=UPI0035196ACB